MVQNEHSWTKIAGTQLLKVHQNLRSWPKLSQLSKTQSAKMYQMAAFNQKWRKPSQPK